MAAADRLVAVGEALTATPVIALVPVIDAATPSVRLVAMLKALLKSVAGTNVTPASSALTLAIAPAAVHTPVAPLYVEVTLPEVPVDSAPAATFDRVRV